MKPLEKFLRHLARTDVTEIALASGRLPCVKIAGAFKPIDNQPMTPDAIYDVLFAAGGSRYVENLGQAAANWTFRLENVGVVAVAAVTRDGAVQARFAVTRRDAPSKTLPSQVQEKRPQPRGGPPAAAPHAPNAASAPHAPNAPARPSSSGDLELDLSAALRGAAAPSGPPPRRLSDASQIAARGDPPALADPFSDDRGNSLQLSDPFGMDEPTAQTAAPDVPQAATLAYALEFDARAAQGQRGIEFDTRAGGGLQFDGTLDALLRAARRERASDCHVIAERPLLLRISGDLVARGEPLDPRMVETLILDQIPARLRAGFERDGSTDFGLEHWKFGRFRVNVVRQRTGIKACFRLIGEEIPTLESLQLPDALAAATHHHQGLIVITGPTGHGKTTTLSAIVDLINTNTTHHIITVEDPVEYVHPRKRAMMSQREVGTHTKTFRSALKGSLREDPDVIVIGELRDTETVRIALAASETGHLVIGTMNTPSAAKTIDRIIDLFPAGDQQQVRLTLAGGLKLIVSQRLVPNADGTAMMAACEVLPGSIALWNLIRDNKTFQIPSLQQRGKGLGIIRLDDSLADLVRGGRTTKDRVMPFAESPDELDARIAGRPAVQLPAHMGGPKPDARSGGTQMGAPQRQAGQPEQGPPNKGGLLAGIFGGKKGG